MTRRVCPPGTARTLVAAAVVGAVLSTGASAWAQPRTTDAASPTPGEVSPSETVDPGATPPTTATADISPPINPLPSYYAINKPRPPGVGDGGVAPPINPVPRPTVDPSAFNTPPRTTGN